MKKKRIAKRLAESLERLLACVELTGADTETDRAVRQAKRALEAFYTK